jgi:hypothetical protein
LNNPGSEKLLKLLSKFLRQSLMKNILKEKFDEPKDRFVDIKKTS